MTDEREVSQEQKKASLMVALALVPWENCSLDELEEIAMIAGIELED